MKKSYIGTAIILTFSLSCVAMHKWKEKISGPIKVHFDAGPMATLKINATEIKTVHNFYAAGNTGCIELPMGTYKLSITTHNCPKDIKDIISFESTTFDGEYSSDQESGSSD